MAGSLLCFSSLLWIYHHGNPSWPASRRKRHTATDARCATDVILARDGWCVLFLTNKRNAQRKYAWWLILTHQWTYKFISTLTYMMQKVLGQRVSHNEKRLHSMVQCPVRAPPQRSYPIYHDLQYLVIDIGDSRSIHWLTEDEKYQLDQARIKLWWIEPRQRIRSHHPTVHWSWYIGWVFHHHCHPQFYQISSYNGASCLGPWTSQRFDHSGGRSLHEELRAYCTVYQK